MKFNFYLIRFSMTIKIYYHTGKPLFSRFTKIHKILSDTMYMVSNHILGNEFLHYVQK